MTCTHKSDETIRGQVFCSFRALLMQKELFLRMAKAGIEAEWPDILRDLDALTGVENGGRRFLVRSRTKGGTVAILRRVGARLAIAVRRIDEEPADGKGNAGLPTDIGRTAERAAKCSVDRRPTLTPEDHAQSIC